MTAQFPVLEIAPQYAQRAEADGQYLRAWWPGSPAARAYSSWGSESLMAVATRTYGVRIIGTAHRAHARAA